MSRKTCVIDGLRYPVVRGRRGQPFQVVVNEEDGRRYQDGSVICDGHSKRYVAAGYKRWRKVDRLEDAEKDEAVYLVPEDQRTKLGKQHDETRAAGFYKNGRKLKNPAGKIQPAPCGAFALRGRRKCYHHGGPSPRGIGSPHSTHLRYSIAARGLAEAYAKHRDGDPTDLSEEIALHRGLIEDRVVPRLSEGMDLKTVERGLELVKSIREGVSESDLPALVAPTAELHALLEKARAAGRSEEEYARHQRALAQASSAQTRRERQLEVLVREQDLLAFQYRVLAAVKDAFISLLRLLGIGERHKKYRKAFQILGQLQEEFGSILAPPEVRR